MLLSLRFCAVNFALFMPRIRPIKLHAPFAVLFGNVLFGAALVLLLEAAATVHQLQPRRAWNLQQRASIVHQASALRNHPATPSLTNCWLSAAELRLNNISMCAQFY
jgi:hypothetical protein